MVNEVVSIKKPFNYKKMLFIFLGFVFVLGILYIIFFLGSVFGSSPNIEIILENPISELLSRYEQQGINISNQEIINQAKLEFNSDYINYALYAMSAHKLHNPPLSSDTPKIKVVLDEIDIYYSEIVKGEVSTYKREIGESDIAIISTKNEIINAMLVKDMPNFMSQSVIQGRTNIEMLAGNFKLASKGYLQMYEDITGESLI